MIAYFDTSAIVPLVVDEPTTETCQRLWTESTRVVSVRLIYPEARAALARAGRMGRLTRSQLNAAVLELDSLIEQVDVIELSPDIARSAGELAQQHGLNRTTVRKRRGRNFVDDAPIRLGRTPKRFIRDPSAPPPD